jgi:hypothetical protein
MSLTPEMADELPDYDWWTTGVRMHVGNYLQDLHKSGLPVSSISISYQSHPRKYLAAFQALPTDHAEDVKLRFSYRIHVGNFLINFAP